MRARADRHLAVILTPVVALALSAPVLAQGKDEKKLKDNERKAAQFLMKAVDHAMASGMAPGTALLMMSPSGKEAPVAQPGAPAMTWRNDALRAGDGKAYMPFTVFVEPGKLTAGPVAAVLRASARYQSLSRSQNSRAALPSRFQTPGWCASTMGI